MIVRIHSMMSSFFFRCCYPSKWVVLKCERNEISMQRTTQKYCVHSVSLVLVLALVRLLTRLHVFHNFNLMTSCFHQLRVSRSLNIKLIVCSCVRVFYVDLWLSKNIKVGYLLSIHAVTKRNLQTDVRDCTLKILPLLPYHIAFNLHQIHEVNMP